MRHQRIFSASVVALLAAFIRCADEGQGPSKDLAQDIGRDATQADRPSADQVSAQKDGQAALDVGPGKDVGLKVDAGPHFSTLPPGAALPSEATCAQLVRRSPWEPRPQNYTANHTTPTAAQLQAYNSESWGGVKDPPSNTQLRPRVTGNFTGTTDEIIQWAACKWGFDEDVVRAQAVAESTWKQDATGDWTTDQSLCPPGTWTGTGCYQSYGLLQLKYIYHAKAAWPVARDDTAFNVDYALAWRRVCYEGYITWLSTPGVPGNPSYGPGDLWGCIGQWFSGSWYDTGAISYISTVKNHLSTKTWAQPNF